MKRYIKASDDLVTYAPFYISDNTEWDCGYSVYMHDQDFKYGGCGQYYGQAFLDYLLSIGYDLIGMDFLLDCESGMFSCSVNSVANAEKVAGALLNVYNNPAKMRSLMSAAPGNYEKWLKLDSRIWDELRNGGDPYGANPVEVDREVLRRYIKR